MQTRQLPVTILSELTAPEGETIRRVGTIGSVGVNKMTVPSTDVGLWESVPVSVVIEAIEGERKLKEYRADVVKRIRQKYSADDEAAIIRKRLALQDGAPDAQDIMDEFAEYHNYAEQCKAQAHAAVYGEEPESGQEGGEE